MTTQSLELLPLRRTALLGLATSAAVFTAGSLRAADITWSAATGDFGTASNWTGGVVPSGGDQAIIGNAGMLDITDNRTVLGLQVRDGAVYENPSGGAGGPTVTCNGSLAIGGQSGDTGTYQLNNALLFAFGGVTIGGSGGTGTLDFPNGFLNKIPGAPLVVGDGNGSDGAILQNSGFINCMAELWIGNGAGSTGTYSIGGSSAIVPADWLIVGRDGGSGTLQISGNASFTKQNNVNPGSHASFASGDGSTATITQTGGRFINVASETRVGDSGTGTATWTQSSGETVLSLLDLGHADSASGTYNLEGGTLTVNRISSGSSGTSTFNFNGGTLKANSYDSNFINDLTAAYVDDFGAIIDTTSPANSVFPSVDLEIPQNLLDAGGGLTKMGPGTLTLSGTSTYTGDTLVQAGTLSVTGGLTQSTVRVSPGAVLGGNGTIAPAVSSFGTVAPGNGIGTLTVAGDAELFGSLEVEITGAEGDQLAVSGALNIESATLDLHVAGVGPTAGVYVIATYGTLVGAQFASVNGLPAGYTVNYAYQGNKIAVTGTPSPYAIWAMETHALTGDDAFSATDFDGDGISNGLEFVLGGSPVVIDDLALLPTGAIVNGRFDFTFRRTDLSIPTSPGVESNDDLDGWTPAVNGQDGVIVSVVDNAFPGGDLVTASFPLPPGGKLFARLQVTLP